MQTMNQDNNTSSVRLGTMCIIFWVCRSGDTL